MTCANPHRPVISGMDDMRIETAYRLRKMLDMLGKSAADICRETGLAPNRFSQYVTGRQAMTLDAALILRRKYGVTLDWIFCGDESGLPARLLMPRLSNQEQKPPERPAPDAAKKPRTSH